VKTPDRIYLTWDSCLSGFLLKCSCIPCPSGYHCTESLQLPSSENWQKHNVTFPVPQPTPPPLSQTPTFLCFFHLLTPSLALVTQAHCLYTHFHPLLSVFHPFPMYTHQRFHQCLKAWTGRHGALSCGTTGPCHWCPSGPPRDLTYWWHTNPPLSRSVLSNEILVVPTSPHSGDEEVVFFYF